MIDDYSAKVFIISGATGGFGALAAKALAERGAKLVLTDLNPEALGILAESLNGECEIVAGDITDPATPRKCVEAAVERFGYLNGAFNNAGVEHKMNRIPDIDSTSIDTTMNVNFKGVLNAMQAQIPAISQHFRETGTVGAILNTASIAAVKGAPKLSVYAASKHAIVGLSRSAAIEYARHGVRVNTLCPAFMRTRMVTGGILMDFDDQEDGLSKLASGIPMGRIGEPEEVLPAILFALSPANSFFTGQEIRLDGGMTA